ncbi:uncharacterized protein BP5553_06578 [Venustampulla echinocandica]|uniref:Uncharacterized protein n=1 Tax=Venustampulla echinocandica TaxID=2656787 RepID=A0A370TKB6_9HELO|nr:uncharacterized protein BP5553_06578 [Venustampulla echinocandica]RDL35966.1 hypothetical protein BP5553_06578 [Venustampulla echinocandica]
MSIRQLPTDPNYGKVPYLCATLGYPPKETYRGGDIVMGHAETPGRKSSNLQHALLRHRNSPKISSLPIRQLRLDSDCSTSVEATEYAAGFLRIPAHQKLFQWTVEGEKRGWPVYPEENERGMPSKAEDTSSCSDSSDGSEEDDDTDYQRTSSNDQLSSFDRRLPPWERSMREHQAITKNIEIHLDFIYPLERSLEAKSHDWLTKPTFSLSTIKDIDRFAIRNLHSLDLYLPNDTAKLNRFVNDCVRYYNLGNSSFRHRRLHDRCKDLIANFVGDFVGSWMEWEHGGYGFLERHGASISKSPEFEEAWKTRHNQWWGGLIPSSVSPILDGKRLKIESSPPPRTIVNRKREPEFIDLSSVSTNDLRPENAKRQRVDHASAEDISRPSRETTSVQLDNLAKDDMDNVAYVTSGYVTRSFPASKVESSGAPTSSFSIPDKVGSDQIVDLQPFFDMLETPPRSSLPTDHAAGHHAPDPVSNASPGKPAPDPTGNAPAARLPVEVVLHTPPVVSPTTVRQVTPRVPKGSTTASSATTTDPRPVIFASTFPSPNTNPSTGITLMSTDSHAAKSELAEPSNDRSISPPATSFDRRPSSRYQLTGSFVGKVEYPHLLNSELSSKQLTRISSSTEKDGPTKPRLRFAIEDSDGMPDDDEQNLVSNKVMSGLSLADLFALVCNRSGKPKSNIAQLTFQCGWGNGAALVVDKYGGEESWTKAKARMNKHFKASQRQLPQTKEFETWVYCGDTTQTSRTDDDNEDS